MKKISLSKKFQNGGVSIFIVTIVAVLVSIVAVSFLRIMLRDQEQASKLDLSQSAYDSAQAGVEDAKRFLHQYQQDCGGGTNLSTDRCRNMHTALTATDRSCYMMNTAGIGNRDNETQIQTSTSKGASNDSDLNQAYTCVKIQKDTSDFLGNLEVGQSSLVPLRGTKEFSKVRLSWHSQKDLTDKKQNVTLDEIRTPLDANATDGNGLLVNREQWTKRVNSPAILKAQFYGYTTASKNSGNVLTSLDNSSFVDGTGLSEMVLFPARGNEAKDSYNLPFARRGNDADSRTNNISPVQCEPNMTTSTRAYSCTVTISLQHNVSPSDTAYLRLTPIYRGAEFKAELLDKDNNIVDFNGIQPKIDSTGRANNQFRRVESRLSFEDPNFPLPDFAVQLEDNSQPLCKDFWVTNKTNSGIKCEEIKETATP